MKLRILFSIILSSVTCFAAEPIFPTIVYDATKDFSKGHFDLESFFTEEEKEVVEARYYSICLDNFKEFATNITQQISEKELASFTLPDLITRIVFLIGEKSIFVNNQCHTLNSFLSKTPELDCDTTAITLYCLLYRLQVQYPHYQILENFYLSAIVGHVMVCVQNDNEFFYTDVNLKLNPGFRLRFVSKDDYQEIVGLTKAALEPVNGEALKEMVLYGNGLYHYQQQNYETALEKLTKALSFNSKGIPSLVCKAVCEYMSGRYEEAIHTIERLLEEGDLDASIFCTWSLAYHRLGRYEEAILVMNDAIDSTPAISPYYHLLRAEAYAALAEEKLKAEQPYGLFLQMNVCRIQQLAKSDYHLGLHTFDDYFYSEVKELRRIAPNKEEFIIWHAEYIREHAEVVQNTTQSIKDYLKALDIELPESAFDMLFPKLNYTNLLGIELLNMGSHGEIDKENWLEVIAINQTVIEAYRENAKPVLNCVLGETLMLVCDVVRKRHGSLAAEKFLAFMLNMSELEAVKIEQAFQKLVLKVKKQLEKKAAELEEKK